MECYQQCTCTQEISPWPIHQITVQFKAKSCLHSKEQSSVNRGWDLVTDSSQECKHLHQGGPEPKQMGSKVGKRLPWNPPHPHLAPKLMLVQFPIQASKLVWPLSIHSDMMSEHWLVCQPFSGKRAGAEESKTLGTPPLKAPVVLFGKGMRVGDV